MNSKLTEIKKQHENSIKNLMGQGNNSNPEITCVWTHEHFLKLLREKGDEYNEVITFVNIEELLEPNLKDVKAINRLPNCRTIQKESNMVSWMR